MRSISSILLTYFLLQATLRFDQWMSLEYDFFIRTLIYANVVNFWLSDTPREFSKTMVEEFRLSNEWLIPLACLFFFGGMASVCWINRMLIYIGLADYLVVIETLPDVVFRIPDTKLFKESVDAGFKVGVYFSADDEVHKVSPIEYVSGKVVDKARAVYDDYLDHGDSSLRDNYRSLQNSNVDGRYITSKIYKDAQKFISELGPPQRAYLKIDETNERAIVGELAMHVANALGLGLRGE